MSSVKKVFTFTVYYCGQETKFTAVPRKKKKGTKELKNVE